MKRLTTIFLALLLIVSLSVPAFADVIYEPDDYFLSQHLDESDRLDRNFRALTEVTVYKSPESAKELWTMAQGDAIHIYYVYTDAQGNLWGYCENYEEDLQGWLPMAYMELIYDYISFEEDYGDSFLAMDGQLDEEYADDMVWFWNYPGSETGETFDMASWASDYFPEYHQVYKDDQGRSWGYVGYYYGRRNFWICLDAPTADFETLYPAGAPEVEPSQPEPTLPAEEVTPQPSSGTAALRTGVTIAVAVCVVATVVLLARMKKKET